MVYCEGDGCWVHNPTIIDHSFIIHLLGTQITLSVVVCGVLMHQTNELKEFTFQGQPHSALQWFPLLPPLCKINY